MKELMLPTVLVVDDDEFHREAVAFDLKRNGFRILEARSGKEAWQLFQKEKVDLVVSDIRMPDEDGIELLGRIRRRDPTIPPVILITGFTEHDIQNPKDWGAEALFNKPVDRKALISASREAVAIARA